MGNESGTGAALRTFEPHARRAQILGEVHARPFHALTSPCRLLRLAFMTDFAAAARDRAAIAAFCESQGAEGPAEGAKHKRIPLGELVLRWEQHSEFTTYTIEVPVTPGPPFAPLPASVARLLEALPQPGPHLASIDLHLTANATIARLPTLFDPVGLAAAYVGADGAFAATDFKAGPDGFVHILVGGSGLTPEAAGALTQRLMEIETYRMLALLGLPEAQRLGPVVKHIEDELTRIARDMTGSDGLEANHILLTALTRLAAQQEAEATAAGYRFSASRAYDGIVHQRLIAIGESRLGQWPTFSEFLARRVAPAMRTCTMMEERQTALAQRLSRTADLLRTRVYVDMEEQNRELMAAMNERTRLQLLMQQTVEGLSVAAVSYYVLGLLGYLFKGAKDAGMLPFDPTIATAAVLPAVLLLVWFLIRRIRRKHSEKH